MSDFFNTLNDHEGVVSTVVMAVLDTNTVSLFEILKTEARLRHLISGTSFVPKAANEVIVSVRQGLQGQQLVVSLAIETEVADVEVASTELAAMGFISYVDY